MFGPMSGLKDRHGITALALLVLSLSSLKAAVAQELAEPVADAISAHADELSIASPNNILTLNVIRGDRDYLSYTVTRGGETVIHPSKLGFIVAGGANLGKETKITGASTRSFDETWEQPWGEKRFIRNHYNELTVGVSAQNGQAYDVIFRLYDDGLGFRYAFKSNGGSSDITILDELTEFNIPKKGEAWWIPAREWNRYEYLYNATPINQAGFAHTPFTVRTDNNLHISIHEAALVNYAGMSLMPKAGGRWEADLAPWSDGTKVKLKAPAVTPWRTIQIADSAAGLIDNYLILNLNDPNKLGDVSWVEPGKYVGIWWGMHLAETTWGSGPAHGATTSEAKRYIDFAAKYGFKGVLIEGWNIGWDGDWFRNGDVFNFTKPYPDFDMDSIAAHARDKGVRIVGHHETSGSVSNYENQLSDAFKYYQKHGVAQIKTGYVADGGEVLRRGKDGAPFYEWHDGQFMAQHYLKVIEEAAKYKISINSHEPIKDTGLRRTYPNWIAREGARGQEYNAWGEPGNPPEHTTILPFTRMLSGPMDFTPGIFDLTFEKARPNNRVETTLAKQLALYVVIYSPIQMAADLPRNYEANLAPFQFIRDVPTDWDDTRVLNAEIGNYVTIARKDRNSDDWFLGAISDEQARHLPVSLSFLEPGVQYEAQIYRDGDDGHWKTNPYAIAIEKKTVTSTDKLDLRLAAGGGMAIRFKRK